MSKLQLEISQQEAPELLEFYTAKRVRLIEDNPAVFNKLKEYNFQIAMLRKLIDDKSEQYPIDAPWLTKIQFVLRDQLDGLTVKEIAAKIADYEKITNPEEVKRVYNSVSPNLSTSNGTLFERFTNKSNEFVYKLKN